MFLAVLLLSVGTSALGATVTLRPSKDTSLFQTNPDNNLGAASLAAGTTKKGEKSRALMLFDLQDQVPANATITSVELTLEMNKAPQSSVASSFGLHRVLVSWGEGDKSSAAGDPATADEATWNDRLFPDTAWSAPGAQAPADYVSAASATRLITEVGSYSFSSTPSMVLDVQRWLAEPQSNFGWILISQSESTPLTARRFGSAEDPDASPSLVIQFSEPASTLPPSITLEPKDQTVEANESVSFRVAANGTEPLTYQWKFNGQEINGATSATLPLTNVKLAQAGNYSVTVNGLGGSAVSRSAVLSVTAPPKSGKRWTIMIYGHGDHNLSQSLVVDMQEMEAAGSGQDFNIVVQADFDAQSEGNVPAGLPPDLASGVSRFLIQKDSNLAAVTSAPVERIPESMNMDDPAVLTQFITWAAQKYPADRYGLILWNHGGQWEGFGGDSQDSTLKQKGNLSTAQIREAVSKAMQSASIPKWEFVSFDTCLMGGAEVLSDFVPLTDVFIACPELDYGDGWDYAAAFNFLKANPEVSALDFGRAEVQAWQAHHLRPGNNSDLELASHALYDLTHYAAFEEKFNAFGSLLSQSTVTRATTLPRHRQTTTQYSVNSVEQIGQPTDYIDLGELADRLFADPSTEAPLKAAAGSLSAAIDSLVAAKVRGARKQLTHALSVYYPVAGSKDNAGYQGLGFSSNPGSTWSQLLSKVAEDRAGDTTAPDIEPALVQVGRKSVPTSFSASVAQPANVSVNVLSGSDAYGMFASIVDNHFTENSSDFVYLGEVLSAEIQGIGTYVAPWNGTLPMLSGVGGESSVALGGFFDDVGSDTLVSFANYSPAGSTNQQLVVLLTQITVGGAKVIAALDGEEEDEGLAPKGIDLRAGGKLTPTYYMERRSGDDPSKWDSKDIPSKSSITIPPNGLDGLSVNFVQLPSGVYSMEIQVVDSFMNESEVLNYSIAVGQGSSAPSLRMTMTSANKIVISWATSSPSFVLEANSTVSATAWAPVSSADIRTEGSNHSFTSTATDDARFFRLRKN